MVYYFNKYVIIISCMLQIGDDKVWEASKLLYNAFKKDDQNRRLDTDSLSQFKKEKIKPLYPHRLAQDGEIQKYQCCQSCCKIDPGRFCCCGTTPPDFAFQKLGLGLCLYFKFIKHACLVFLIVAFITIATCLACYLVANQNGFNPTADYQTFLFSTTLGTFSSEHVKCQYQKNPSSGAVSFNLKCPYGRVNYFGPTYSKQTLNTLYNCKVQRRTYEAGTTVSHSGLTTSCSDISSCTISFTPTTYQSAYLAIAFSYQCLDQTYKLGNVSVKSQQLFYFVVAIDIFCCLLLTLFYCSESKAEDAEIEYFKQQQLSLNDFSIKIKGINLGTFNEEFNAIIHYFNQRLGRDSINQFVQVKAPDRLDFIQYQNKKNEAYENLYQFISEEFFDLQTNPNEFDSYQKFISNNFAEGKYQKFKQKLIKLLSEYHYTQYDANQQKIDKSCSIFLVLNTIKAKNQIFQLQQNGCCSKYYRIQNRQYKLSQPPAPDLIIWKNKGKWTLIRTIISWILTLCICFGSYALFGYIQAKQNQYLSSYNFNINCDVLYTTAQMTIYNPPPNDSNYLSCFCKSNMLDLSLSQCSDWRSTYFTYLAIPIIISLFLVIYNVIVSIFFKLLSKFQSHRLIADQLYSFTIKRSFMLIMNMALIMIILNMKFTASVDMTEVGFLLQGRYNDITPDWYNNIGTVIIMTMIFNISFPIIELIMVSFMKCLKRCWDRKCCFRKTSCKTKSQYIQLFSNDVYPIEERYACIISILIITLAFSCIIPILNLICGLSLLLLYFSDRVLVFKVYQTPVNYGSQLHKLILKVVYVGLIAHFALTAFFLTEPEIIAANSAINESYQLDVRNRRIKSILSTVYVIPYVGFALLFAAWSIFSNTLIALCKKCCEKNEEGVASKYKSQQSFYDSLSLYQISRLKMVIESEISKLAIKNSSLHTITNNSSVMNETMKAFSINQLNTSQAPASEHENLLRRSLVRLEAWQTLRKREGREGAHLIGFPSYEIMISDEAFEQDNKNNQLAQSINNLLKGAFHNFTQ